jgi:hypothetical protein
MAILKRSSNPRTKKEEPTMAGATATEALDEVATFKSKHPKASGPVWLEERKIRYLRNQGLIKKGPFNGKVGGVKVVYALTKPTGNSPHGEIVASVG